MKSADFIFFWHGFTLLLIGTMLFLRRNDAEAGYHRFQISFFCFLLGLSEWSAVFSSASGPAQNMQILRFILFISAFIMLFESVRAAAEHTWRWLAAYPVSALVTGIAYNYGIDPVLAVQYSAAVPLIILAAFVLRKGYSASGNSLTGNHGAIPFIAYIYASTWLFPAPGCTLPPVWDGHFLTGYVVISAAVIRAVCISSGLVIILLKRYNYFFKTERPAGRLWMLSGCVAILAVTFIVNTVFMNVTGNDMRRSITGIARAIAVGINPDRIQQLTFTPEDKNKPAFTRIREQMQAWGNYMGLRSIYSMVMKDGRLYFGPENIDEGDPMASPPGTEYLKPPRAFIDAWISGMSGVAGPYTDEYGSFVSGFAPVFDRLSGRIVMLVAVDYDVRLWNSWNLKGRAMSFVPFMIITVWLLIWLVIFETGGVSRAERTGFFSRNIESICCFTIGIILTCIVSFYMNFFEKRIESVEFYNLADSWSNIIRTIITDSRYHTEELSLYFENSEEVTWSEFKGFYSRRNILPHISIAWYPLVKASEINSFESYMQRQGLHDYRITKRTGESGRGEGVYYPLAYIVPLEYGKKELGNDISGYREIRESLETGLLTMIKLEKGGEQNKTCDIILLNPVYKNGKNIGFVRSVIDLEILLSRVISYRNSINLGIRVDLSDIGGDGAESTLISYPPRDSDLSAAKETPDLFSLYPVFYSGRTLCMKIYLSEQLVASKISIAGPLALALGIFLSAAVSLFAAYIISRRNSLEDEIENRTGRLRENEERYRIVSGFAGQMVYGRDLESGQQNWSGRIEEITGFSPAAYNSMRIDEWQNLIHPEDREMVSAVFEEAKQSGKIFLCEYRLQRADGTYLTVEDNGAFLHYGSGRPVSMLGVVKDITDRKRMENDLKESEERCRVLQDASSAGIAIHDKGIILLCNKGLSGMTGYTVEELTGMNCRLLIAQGCRDSVMEKILSGYGTVYDAEGLKRDGTIFPVEVNTRTVQYKGRSVSVTEFREITESIRNHRQAQPGMLS